MKVINFFAGPGAGKSTTAAGLFFEMKCLGLKVELVTEYAKDLAYSGMLGDPVKAFCWNMADVQLSRLSRLKGKVNFAVTDSPLIKDISYYHHTLDDERDRQRFRDAIMHRFDRFDNFNVWVNRVKPYAPYGRRESEESARAVDDAMTTQMGNRMHMTVDGDREAPKRVLWRLIELGMVNR